jgi:hypothetical protein
MLGLEPAPVAVFFELDFALDKLFVLVAPIVDALALVAGKFDKSVLGHTETIPHIDRLCKQNFMASGVPPAAMPVQHRAEPRPP